MPAMPFRVHNARDLGTAVRYFRSEAHFSQAELAKRSSVHRVIAGLLRDWKRGSASLDHLIDLTLPGGCRGA